MDLQKIKKTAIVCTFLICFVSHFVYTIFPNFITSIFFPVNESIWEHIKMMVSSILLWQIIEYFLLNKYNIKYNNFSYVSFIICLISIPLFLIIYYPVYLCAGNNFVLNLLCLFITIYFVNVIGYFILCKSEFKLDIVGIIGTIILYIIFSFFTYFPPKNDIFKDPINKSYGILVK